MITFSFKKRDQALDKYETKLSGQIITSVLQSTYLLRSLHNGPRYIYATLHAVGPKRTWASDPVAKLSRQQSGKEVAMPAALLSSDSLNCLTKGCQICRIRLAFLVQVRGSCTIQGRGIKQAGVHVEERAIVRCHAPIAVAAAVLVALEEVAAKHLQGPDVTVLHLVA